MPLQVCAVTSTRADWAALAPVIKEMHTDPFFRVQIVVTGQHYSERARQIADGGFEVACAIDMKLESDTAKSVTDGLARAVAGCGEAYDRLKPDLLVVDGDRYEILGAVMAAYLARIPVAHMSGGDVTEGAMDDAFRHAITKMAHLHFATTPQAAAHIRQLGEEPDCVFVVGSTGLDHIRMTPALDRAQFFEAVGLNPRRRNLVITFHPETLARDTVTDCREMLAALDQVGPEVGLLFTGTNADVQGMEIGKLIEDFVRAHDNAALHPSLGSVRYFSALRYVDAVVGNSSSGLYEAPSFGTPTVNIGNRQKGRVRAASVIDVVPERAAIRDAVACAFSMGRMRVDNPYGDGHAAERIVAAIKATGNPSKLLNKRFVECPGA